MRPKRPPARIGVRMTPGHRALTRTPYGAASIRRARVKPTTAAFVAPYDAVKGVGMKAAIDAVLTMCPNPCCTMRGYAAWIPCTTPIRLTSTM